jgi:hypothetical protein
MASQSPPNEKQELFSYVAKPPSVGIDILVVGPSKLTKSLASALIQVQFDSSKRPIINENDAAIEALRKHCFASLPTNKRTIHTVERLRGKEWPFRMDHIVIVSAPDDLGRDGVTETIRMLHDDYIIYQRVSVVQVLDYDHPQQDVSPDTSYSSSIATFQLFVRDTNSLLTAARILLQRTKVGIREGSPTVSHISPLLFGSYE